MSFIYILSCDEGILLQRDPKTSVPGQSSNKNPTALSNGKIWAYNTFEITGFRLGEAL
jgi:hypothetical protein